MTVEEQKNREVGKEEIVKVIEKNERVKGGKGGGGVRKEREEGVDGFLTSEEGGKSGETRKVVVLDEEWLEGEGEPRMFQIPQKGIGFES